MQYVGWSSGGSTGASVASPCPSCIQAQLLISVLRQGMHPACIDASPQQHSATPFQVRIVKVKGGVIALNVSHSKATERHLPYGITVPSDRDERAPP